MAQTIQVMLDKTEKYLDKRREIKDYGIPWLVDGFKVTEFCGNSSVRITFFKLIDEVWNEKTRRMMYKQINVMSKIKRVKFVDNELLINIAGLQYVIGKYKEV